jgi:hypothetical protein
MKALPSALLVLMLGVVAPRMHAAPVSGCAADFSTCSLVEDGQVLTLPGFAISGDVLIVEPSDNSIVSDVFRIFNDLFDSGGGTGLGTTAFLYSADLGNLPDPSAYSVNAVTIIEGPSIGGGLTQTDYNGNGTIYSIFSSDRGAATPEPSTFALFGLGAITLGWWRRKRYQR